MTDSHDDDVRRQDAALAARGLAIWVGAEPTFTRRDSQEAPWLFEAEGGDKEERARALLVALAPRIGGHVRLCRAAGRKYPGEEKPRFAYGATWERATVRRGVPCSVDACALDGPPEEPPRWDPATAYLTVTPDPAVVEVNMAPAEDLASFRVLAEDVHAAALEAGLSPVRYRYNGEVVESGGGGQITLGGPTPEASPFFAFPHLLPGLLRLFNRHPSLSYLFAPGCVGSASQGPRPDEGVRERFDELGLCLDRLAGRSPELSPAELWSSLAPLLVDASGNSHRAELNVEKLWNPFLPGRGRMGVVEFRSFGMPDRPEGLVARAALLRALAARTASVPAEEQLRETLVDWGPALHDRFALPSFLLRDLARVLEDLAARGLGLGPSLEAILLAPPEPLARVELAGAVLTLTPAREFWPLLGDVASQEGSGSRLVDSSTERIEAAVEAGAGEAPGRLWAMGREIPLRHLPAPGSRERFVAGIRYRAFEPGPGLHPGLPAVDPLTFAWERDGRSLEVLLHRWIPGGGAYPGLPADAAEAARRRAERVVVARPGEPGGAGGSLEKTRAPATPGQEELLTIDLRRLPARVSR